ncbi:MAG TPA: endonuclease/exonuclease/phosphatase family protein [Cyclobacteriaceae bacterium]
MKIITWNCNMAFRKKADLILAHKPDLLVVPECEHPDKIKFLTPPSDALWFGINQNKGLGIFSFSDLKLQVMEEYNPEFRMIIPIRVKRKRFTLILYAIWANNPSDRDGHYVTQIWKALKHYDALLGHKRTVLVGDFNSNTLWDKPRRKGNHSHVVEVLQQKRISSTYHRYFQQEQGKEIHPTFYLYKNKEKPYHLDYCFVSADLSKNSGWLKWAIMIPGNPTVIMFP